MYPSEFEPRTGVAVPVPRSADAGRGVERLHVHPLLAQQMKLVKPGDAGADHRSVELQRRGSVVRRLFDH